MSTKRASAEFGNDDQKNEASDPLFQQEDNAKRAKLSSLSDTTLQDLPIELLEHILIKVIIMEVKGMNLAKCVWKEKADPVISRLRTVCSQWNNILATDFFRNELHRTLIAAHGKILLELLYKSPIQQDIWGETALKDDIFMLYSPLDKDAVINVYDRNNIAEIKDVISLPEGTPASIAACSVSNCLYVESSPSVFRVTKDEEHQFNISPWINDHTMPDPTISVSASGSLLIFSEEQRDAPAKIRIYNASGSLQHEIMLSRDIVELKPELIHVDDVIQKSNGNLVLVLYDHGKCKLMEIDMNVKVVRQYKSSLSGGSCAHFADIHGRIMITDAQMGMELLDSEFNLLDCSSPLRDVGHFREYLYYNLYDYERNEIMCITGDLHGNSLLAVIRLTAE